jgi:hypothetical protein
LAGLRILGGPKVDLVFVLAVLALYALTHGLILGVVRLGGVK